MTKEDEAANCVKFAKGRVFWLTGLSGSGKSTIAEALDGKFHNLSYDDVRGQVSPLKVEILDGDEIRTNLSKGLGFSKEDRDTNVRRIGYVARLLARNDVTVIVASISPYKAVRDEIRATIPKFTEIYCDCPLQALQIRDPKGLYAKVAKGEIKHFTGVDDPYEAPENPDIHLHTNTTSLDDCVEAIIKHLKDKY